MNTYEFFTEKVFLPALFVLLTGFAAWMTNMNIRIAKMEADIAVSQSMTQNTNERLGSIEAKIDKIIERELGRR
jgi:hypothetical protein